MNTFLELDLGGTLGAGAVSEAQMWNVARVYRRFWRTDSKLHGEVTSPASYLREAWASTTTSSHKFVVFSNNSHRLGWVQ
jgi:hypothetical protein